MRWPLYIEGLLSVGILLLDSVLYMQSSHVDVSTCRPLSREVQVSVVDIVVLLGICLHSGLSELFQLSDTSSVGELYPTEVRTTAHGLSAGFAKLGALWATIFFNYIGFRARFW